MNIVVSLRQRVGPELMDARIDRLAAFLDHPPHIVMRDAEIVGIIRLCADPGDERGVLRIVPCFRRDDVFPWLRRASSSKTKNGHVCAPGERHRAANMIGISCW